MLSESQLFTFIDEDRKFALYFLEGQKLIYDLLLTHRLRQAGISYFSIGGAQYPTDARIVEKGRTFLFLY